MPATRRGVRTVAGDAKQARRQNAALERQARAIGEAAAAGRAASDSRTHHRSARTLSQPLGGAFSCPRWALTGAPYHQWSKASRDASTACLLWGSHASSRPSGAAADRQSTPSRPASWAAWPTGWHTAWGISRPAVS